MISCRRFLLSRGQRVSLLGALFYLAANENLVFPGAFFYLAANEEPLLRGAFFYLAANEDPGRFILPRGQRGTSSPGRFILPRGQRGALLVTGFSFIWSLQWRYSLRLPEKRRIMVVRREIQLSKSCFVTVSRASSLYCTRSIPCMCRFLSSCNMRKVSF